MSTWLEVAETVTVCEVAWRHEEQCVRSDDADPDVHEDRRPQSVENVNGAPGVQVPDEAKDDEEHADGPHGGQTIAVLRHAKREDRHDAEHRGGVGSGRTKAGVRLGARESEDDQQQGAREVPIVGLAYGPSGQGVRGDRTTGSSNAIGLGPRCLEEDLLLGDGLVGQRELPGARRVLALFTRQYRRVELILVRHPVGLTLAPRGRRDR